MDSFSRDPFERLASDPGFAADGGQDAGHQRTRSRDSLFLTAKMTLAGKQGVEVRVRNLSENGLMAEVGKPIPNGTTAEFDIRGIGPVQGTVVWFAEGRIGVALEEPIDPKLARKPVGARRKS